MKNFFREDLKLNNKWWHRALKIIFFMSLIITTVGLVKWSIEYNKGYKEIYKLSQNIPDTPTKLKDIVNNLDKEKKFIVSTSKPYKDQNDSRFNVYKDITFCSLKIDEQFLDLLSENGGIGKYELYSGPMFGRKLLNPTEFRSYLESNNINCLTLDSYTGTYGELVPMISINYEVQNMSL
jgi:hypothetical protein